jgi:hypothetical protein
MGRAVEGVGQQRGQEGFSAGLQGRVSNQGDNGLNPAQGQEQQQQQQLLQQQADLEKELEQLHGLLVVQEDGSSSSTSTCSRSSRAGRRSRGSSIGCASPTGDKSSCSKQRMLAWEQAQAVAGGLTMRLRRRASSKSKSGPLSPVGQAAKTGPEVLVLKDEAGGDGAVVAKLSPDEGVMGQFEIDVGVKQKQLAAERFTTTGNIEGLGGCVGATRSGSVGGSVKLPTLPQVKSSSRSQAVAAALEDGICPAEKAVGGERMIRLEQQHQQQSASSAISRVGAALTAVENAYSKQSSNSVPEEVSEAWKEPYELEAAQRSSSNQPAAVSSRKQPVLGDAGGDVAGTSKREVQSLSHRRE